MNRIVRLLPLLIIVFLTGCIKNDLPFPRIPQEILSIAAVGESAKAVIDAENLTVSLFLDETTNPYEVRFSDFTYTEGAECSLNLLEGTYNLTKPLTLDLSLYQTYTWTITATQEIIRRFSVAGQIGETVFDIPGHRIIVNVPESADLSRLTLLDFKLGPEGNTSVTPDIQPGVIDLSSPLHLDVTIFGHTEQWTIYADVTEEVVSITEADAWSQIIWLYASAPEGGTYGFRYREENSDEWIEVPTSMITIEGGSFRTHIDHLTPLTTYSVQAVYDGQYSAEMSLTTEATEILPGGSFSNWWLKNNKIWCPWAEDGTPYWDTGNTGAATLGKSNVYPSDHTPDGQGLAACLETRFVGIGILGKLAAGSIYTGSFKKIDGTNGILDFGRPWTLRPTKLRGYMQYTTAPINYASSEYKYLMDRPDSCHIYIALTDWNEPYEIRTNPNNLHLFNKNSPEVIAYGELIRGDNTDGYVPFEIVLQYRSKSRRPKYILVTCAASKYGDFFTGGAGATLYVDQLELSYDY